VAGLGDGVAETPGGPVFAPLTLPGETVRGEVVDGRMEAPEILEASPDRIAPGRVRGANTGPAGVWATPSPCPATWAIFSVMVIGGF
jgi:tRNA/tmRNA/rRNA uracil-C5-methylase (TrmA/RlmC/RlmD family)